MDSVKSEDRIFVIQFSHDDVRWFGYGADAITLPTRFNEAGGIAEYERVLSIWHAPYPASFLRLVDSREEVVRHDILGLIRG